MTGRDPAPLGALPGKLQADYPGWRFAVRHRSDGSRLEACRTQATTGLYAVITADPAELRRELDNAATGRAPHEPSSRGAPGNQHSGRPAGPR